MRKSDGNKNLITIYRTYYKLGIQNFLGVTANSIFLGLLYKFNELNFPESIKISNREMLSLSGIKDIRAFRRGRDILVKYLQNDSDKNTWLVKYEGDDKFEYVTYYINYAILQDSDLVNVINTPKNRNHRSAFLQTNCKQIANKTHTRRKQNADNMQVTRTQDADKMSKLDKDRQNENGDLCSDPAKNALLSNTIQYNTIQNNDQPTKISGTDLGILEEKDLMIRNEKNDKKGEKDEEKDFKYVLEHDKNKQEILIKRWDDEKKKRFIEYMKGLNNG